IAIARPERFQNACSIVRAHSVQVAAKVGRRLLGNCRSLLRRYGQSTTSPTSIALAWRVRLRAIRILRLVLGLEEGSSCEDAIRIINTGCSQTIWMAQSFRTMKAEPSRSQRFVLTP